MKPFFAWLIFGTMCVMSPLLQASTKPDFSNPEEVLSDMRTKTDACSKAGAKCAVQCGYGMKTIKTFMKKNPDGDPSILQQRWQPCFDAYRNAGLSESAAPAKSGDPAPDSADTVPDFSDHAAVVAGIKSLQTMCAGDTACEKECGYSLKALKNFNHPQPHYAGLRKTKWEGCRNKVPGKKAPAAQAKATFDLNNFVIAGLQLGGNMSPVKSRLSLLKAHGYFKKTNNEYAVTKLPERLNLPGPDVVRNYEGTIRESTVHVFFEAVGDGRIYKINFEQKEPMDVEATSSALIQRFGKPSKYQGKYLIWGCTGAPMEGFCVKARPAATNLTIWAFSEDVKNDGYKMYDKEMLKAKGVKAGSKF